jgi:hypothetical protein
VAGRPVLDQDVRRHHQAPELLAGYLHPALAGHQVHLLRLGQPGPGGLPLDPHHLGTEAPELAGGERGRDPSGDLDHPHPFERRGVGCQRFTHGCHVMSPEPVGNRLGR